MISVSVACHRNIKRMILEYAKCISYTLHVWALLVISGQVICVVDHCWKYYATCSACFEKVMHVPWTGSKFRVSFTTNLSVHHELQFHGLVIHRTYDTWVCLMLFQILDELWYWDLWARVIWSYSDVMWKSCIFYRILWSLRLTYNLS